MKFKDKNQTELDRQRREQEFLKKCEEKGAFNYIEIIGDYKTKKTPIKCKCVIHGNFYNRTPDQILNKLKCPCCIEHKKSLKRKKTHEEFLQECKEKGLLERINIIGTYKGNRIPIKVQCKKHLDVFWEPVPYALLVSTGQCKKCLQKKYSESYLLTKEEVNQRLVDNNIPFELVGEYKGNDIKTDFKCKHCDKIYNCAPGWIFSGRANCPFCGDDVSFSNKLIRYLLLDLQAENFRYEFKEVWTNNYRYDAYFTIKNEKWLIEMDGAFHFKEYSVSDESLEERKRIDKEKDKLAKENGYNLIRINCFSDSHLDIVNNIKNSELGRLFDLNNFDWNSCLQKAEKNLVKEVCEYFNKYKISPPKMCKIFPLHDSTIRTYLRRGTELGWCNYTYKMFNTKKVVAFEKESMKKIREFDTIKKCRDYILEKYGIKLYSGAVSSVCKNKLIQSKGFFFKYIEE